MKLVIRTAAVSDAAALAGIYNQSIGTATLDLIKRDADHFIQFLYSLEENETLLVMELSGEVVGYGVLKQYSWKEGYRYTGETSVFFEKNHRGKGLGRLLKKTLIETARELGYRHLVARIMAKNKVSIHYNQKLGYELVGIQKNIGHIDGEWFDVAILQLLL